MEEQEKLGMEALDEVAGGKGEGFEFINKFSKLSKKKQAAILAAIVAAALAAGEEVGSRGAGTKAVGRGAVEAGKAIGRGAVAAGQGMKDLGAKIGGLFKKTGEQSDGDTSLYSGNPESKHD